MPSTITRTTIDVELVDAEGYEIGRSVPVVLTVSSSTYMDGQDADGNRGERRTDIEVLDVEIAYHDLVRLNGEQVEQVIAEATARFEQEPSRYTDTYDPRED